jgi:hypothetical protein
MNVAIAIAELGIELVREYKEAIVMEARMGKYCKFVF